MLEVVDEIPPECTIQVLSGNKTWSIKMRGYVDDKRHCTSSIKNQVNNTCIKAMEISVSTWYELLLFAGGES